MDKGKTSSFLFFCFSPWLSLPFAFNDIYKFRKSGFICVAGCFGVLSYLYLPQNSSDKSYYFNLHDYFSGIGLLESYYYILYNFEDITFYFLIALFGNFGLSLSLLSGLLTFTTISIFFFVFYQTIRYVNISRSSNILLFFCLILCISLPPLFSGIRFYLGVSFCLLSIYFFYFKNSLVWAAIVGIFTSTIHFSMAPLFLVTLLAYSTRRYPGILRFVYFLSLLFIIGRVDFSG